jgi:hypothetical protein
MEDGIHQAFLDELEKISKVGVGVYTPGAPKRTRTPTAQPFKSKVKAPKPTTPAAPLAEAPPAAPVPGPAYEGL